MECKFCPKKYTGKRECDRHMRQNHNFDSVADKKEKKAASRVPALPFNFQRDIARNLFNCNECDRQFLSADERNKHAETHSMIKPYNCSHCKKSFAKSDHKRLHEHQCLSYKPSTWSKIQREEDDTYLTLTNSALKSVAKTYELEFATSEDDMLDRFQQSLVAVYHHLKAMRHEANFKYYISLKCSFYKPVEPDVVTDPPVVFNSETIKLLPSSDIREEIEVVYLNIIHQIETFQENGSGWSLKNLISLQLNMIKYDPMKASSFIELPKDIKKKEACNNIQNEDQKCFIWSVLAHLHPVIHGDNQHYVSHYKPFEKELDMDGIDIPVPITQISRFENQNNISVNVFGINEKKLIFPVRVTEEKKQQHVNLLYLSNATYNH